MTWVWIIGVSVVGCLVLLYLNGRWNETAVWKDWTALATREGDRLYEAVEGQIGSQMELAEMTYRRALACRELGSWDDARRLVQRGYDALAIVAPNVLRLLGAMGVFSRMVSAMAPTSPLRPRRFSVPQLMSLAFFHQIVHRFLVSTAERFRFRLFVLSQGVRMVSRFLFSSTQRIAVAKEHEIGWEWKYLEDLRHDFHTLTDETLQSFRVLLISTAAERLEDIERHLRA